MQLWPNKLKVKITRLQKDTDASNLAHRLRDVSRWITYSMYEVKSR
jgi:hypothetical protein